MAFAALAILVRDGRVSELRNMRDHLTEKFKNSGIVPERELDHARVVAPVLEEIDRLIEGAIVAG